MKYSSEFSEIEVLENTLKTKNRKNLFNAKSDFKYLDFNIEDIKEIEIKTLTISKTILILCIIFGVMIPIGSLQKKEYTNPFVEWYDSPYIMVDTTFEERMSSLFMGVIVIGLGVYFSKKYKKQYDGMKGIQIKYIQNNKEKTHRIYHSHNEENVNEAFEKLKQIIG